jgi:hypothetical protein
MKITTSMFERPEKVRNKEYTVTLSVTIANYRFEVIQKISQSKPEFS